MALVLLKIRISQSIAVIAALNEANVIMKSSLNFKRKIQLESL